MAKPQPIAFSVANSAGRKRPADSGVETVGRENKLARLM